MTQKHRMRSNSAKKIQSESLSPDTPQNSSQYFLIWENEVSCYSVPKKTKSLVICV